MHAELSTDAHRCRLRDKQRFLARLRLRLAGDLLQLHSLREGCLMRLLA